MHAYGAHSIGKYGSDDRHGAAAGLVRNGHDGSRYREVRFAGTRSGFVCAWTHRSGGGVARIVPDNHADFIVSSTGDRWLVGPATTVDLPELPAGTLLHGARIHTAALRAVTGAHGPELRDTKIPIDDLLPSRIARILTESLTEGRFGEPLARTLWPDLRIDARVDTAVAALTDSAVSIETLANHLAVTPRHLRRLVETEAGLTPKTVQLIGRLQRAIRLVRGEPDMPPALVAAAAGYSDQAHFGRDARRLTGVTPAALGP
ncbi:AraC family transcriptional regulator [Nocardia jinanensis]|uniref:Transcriptional regulator n=1 Tax=Nocardia jinanensis TaxID=382504 RepID=A0A917R9F4_9NOCA|nr:helix-turn-helix domain-containing protein [Nocardia jinanensis]GGK97085.1 transcriptional regulator [Nocardia jinanensis]